MALPKIKVTLPESPKKTRQSPLNNGLVSKESSKLSVDKTSHRDVKRPSFEIAKSYVEMNFAVLMKAPTTPEEAKKANKAARKAARRDDRKRHRVRNALLSLLGLLILCAVLASVWWMTAIQPVDKNDTSLRQFVVDKGATTTQVAVALQKTGFIRNAFAFELYARFNGSVIQAGTHLLSISDPMIEIVDKLAQAETNEISIQIPPGLTLQQLRNVWKKYDYTDAEIDAAYSAIYNSGILDGRPKGASLEGYIYPDTYRIYSTDKLEAVIQKALDQFTEVAQKNNLRAHFAAHGLTFYQGLILSSIVTREVSNANDQKTVAGVFYNRLASDMTLGSDVTFQYAFDQGLCEIDSPDCDSTYNTRIHGGLPPGPISNPSLSALLAVANPTKSDYYYFVAGDDGKTYYSKTSDDHEANVTKHCRTLCQ